jgi:hypothetical protein
MHEAWLLAAAIADALAAAEPDLATRSGPAVWTTSPSR